MCFHHLFPPIAYLTPVLWATGAASAIGEELIPVEITVRAVRVLTLPSVQGELPTEKSGSQSSQGDPHGTSEKSAPDAKKKGESHEIELNFMPLESRIEIFTVEAALRSGGNKVTLGIGYEERHPLDGEFGTGLLIPEGRTLKVASGVTSLLPNGCYVCYAIGPNDAMTFILDATNLGILHAWKSDIKHSPLASTAIRLEKTDSRGFRWHREVNK